MSTWMYNWHQRSGTVYMTSGIGYGNSELSAFDAAEIDANIVCANAVKVSSFIPPTWHIINSEDHLSRLTDYGVFLPMAYAHAVSNNTTVAATMAIGVNADGTKASIIAEHADINFSREESLYVSEITLKEAFANRSWRIDRLEEIGVEAKAKENLFACALVAAVFIIDHSEDAVSEKSGLGDY